MKISLVCKGRCGDYSRHLGKYKAYKNGYMYCTECAKFYPSDIFIILDKVGKKRCICCHQQLRIKRLSGYANYVKQNNPTIRTDVKKRMMENVYIEAIPLSI